MNLRLWASLEATSGLFCENALTLRFEPAGCGTECEAGLESFFVRLPRDSLDYKTPFFLTPLQAVP